MFGVKKGLLFSLNIPRVMVTGRIRDAFEAMGKCGVVIGGKRYNFEHPDARFIEEIMVQKCYNPTSNLEIGPDDTVLDLGANVGVFSIYAGTCANRGRVVAVEPELENFTFLKDNVKANGLLNVVLVNAALSNKTGNVALNVSSAPGGNTIMDEKSLITQVCSGLTMEDLLSEHSIESVDFLKMDVEGAEFFAFERTEWLEKVKRVAMEIHPRFGDPSLIVRVLEKAGFTLRQTTAYNQEYMYVYAWRSDYLKGNA